MLPRQVARRKEGGLSGISLRGSPSVLGIRSTLNVYWTLEV